MSIAVDGGDESARTKRGPEESGGEGLEQGICGRAGAEGTATKRVTGGQAERREKRPETRRNPGAARIPYREWEDSNGRRSMTRILRSFEASGDSRRWESDRRASYVEGQRRIRVQDDAMRRCVIVTEQVPAAELPEQRVAARSSEDAARKESGRRAVGTHAARSAREA